MRQDGLFSCHLMAGAAVGVGRASLAADDAATHQKKLDLIQTVVVIFGENRSFDNLYGYFPGANGLPTPRELRRPSSTAMARR